MIVNQYDQDYYKKYIKDELPDKIFDSHVHMWTRELIHENEETEAKTAGWVHQFCLENFLPGGELQKMYAQMLAGKKVSSLVFGWVESDVDVSANNRYVGEQIKNNPALRGLAVVKAGYGPDRLMREVEENGLIGLKPYPTFAPAHILADDIRITDMVTKEQLSLANERGWVVLLHLPRSKRLADRANIEDILAIEKNFPHIRMIVAHIGGAYCPEDIGDAFDVLKSTKNMMFDFAAHTNTEVFKKTLSVFGPGRIVFGSDLPITTMRLKREHKDGRYINIIPKGTCGDIAGDIHMREAGAQEAQGITFFLYESIAAMIRAARETGLSRSGLEKIFYGNAKDLIG